MDKYTSICYMHRKGQKKWQWLTLASIKFQFMNIKLSKAFDLYFLSGVSFCSCPLLVSWVTDRQACQIPSWQLFLRGIDDHVRTGINLKHGLLTQTPWGYVLRCQCFLWAQSAGLLNVSIFSRDLGLLRKNKIFFLVNEIVVTEYKKEGAITNNLLSRYNISAKVFLD